MIFAVGEDNDDFTGLTFWVKRGHTLLNGCADGSALHRDGLRANGIQKQLDCSQIECQWSLHIGVSCKNHKTSPVAIQTSDDAFYGALGKVEPGHAQVFRHHRAAHIKGYHNVDAFGFHFFKAGPCFRRQHAHGQECQRCAPDQKLPNGPSWAGVGPQSFAQL